MKKTLITGVMFGGIILTGCTAKSQEPYRDAGISHRNDEKAEVFTMPDGFSNVASKCDGHGNRIFVIYKGDDNRGSVAVVPDSECETP